MSDFQIIQTKFLKHTAEGIKTGGKYDRKCSYKGKRKKMDRDTLVKGFFYREEIINQINCAEVSREYTNFYMALKFKVDNNEMQKIQTNIRVPVEMHVHRSERAPIQFLLHIFRGYLSELEIFNADSSEMDEDINLENGEVEIIINPKLEF